MSDPAIELINDGTALLISFRPGAPIASGDFPHPLAVADFATDGGLIALTLHGSLLDQVKAAVA